MRLGSIGEEVVVTSKSNVLGPDFLSELRRQDLLSPTLILSPSGDLSLHRQLYLMPPTTWSRARKKPTNEPTRPVLKIKLTPQQVRSTIQPPVTEEDRAAIGKVAALEAQLCDKRTAELQEALTLPTPSERVATNHPIPGPAASTAEDQSSHHSNSEQEEGDIVMEETPLVYQ